MFDATRIDLGLKCKECGKPLKHMMAYPVPQQFYREDIYHCEHCLADWSQITIFELNMQGGMEASIQDIVRKYWG